jgi:hypothetical protein
MAKKKFIASLIGGLIVGVLFYLVGSVISLALMPMSILAGILAMVVAYFGMRSK